MRTLILALTLTLNLSVTPAYAEPSTTTPLYGLRYTDSLAIAIQFWQQPLPCHVVFYAATPAELEEFTGSAGATAAVRSVQAGPDCPIWFSLTRYGEPTVENRIDSCSAQIHEVGHLLGHEHDTDPFSVMFAVQTFAVRGCVRRFLPARDRAAWREDNGSAYATRPPAFTPEPL